VEDHVAGVGDESRAMPPAATIPCVDCGGTAHLLTAANEDDVWMLGDTVAYRCEDCRDRWDIVLEDPWSASSEPLNP
jgi:hypothetical protein